MAKCGHVDRVGQGLGAGQQPRAAGVLGGVVSALQQNGGNTVAPHGKGPFADRGHREPGPRGTTGGAAADTEFDRVLRTQTCVAPRARVLQTQRNGGAAGILGRHRELGQPGGGAQPPIMRTELVDLALQSMHGLEHPVTTGQALVIDQHERLPGIHQVGLPIHGVHHDHCALGLAHDRPRSPLEDAAASGTGPGCRTSAFSQTGSAAR